MNASAWQAAAVPQIEVLDGAVSSGACLNGFTRQIATAIMTEPQGAPSDPL
jgi:hypothetical protein